MAAKQEFDVQRLLTIANRHKWWLIVPTLALAGLAFAFGLLLPNEYRSETLILVERQQVPSDIVKPTVTADLQDRLQSMTQEILSRTRLQRIIDNFGLFRQPTGPVARVQLKLRGYLAKVPGLNQFVSDPGMDDLVSKMRSNINIQLIQRKGDNVTAFKISYIAESPQLAQAVTSEITSLFIEENLKAREQMAEKTTEFVDTELETARTQLTQQEEKLKQYKSQYMGQLPNQEAANLQLLAQAQAQLQSNSDAINRLKQEEIYLQNIIAQREAVLTGDTSGQRPSDIQAQLTQLESQLTDLQAKYTEQHPDVVRTKEQIATLRTKLAEESRRAGSSEPKEKPHGNLELQDSALVQARSQLEASRMNMAAKERQQKQIETSIGELRNRVRMAPLREQQYLDLTRDYSIAKGHYESLLQKKNLSDMAQNLEKRQQGEQFRVLDPANLPGSPYRPNRAFMTLAGAMVGLMLGGGVVGAKEAFDRSLRSSDDAENYLEVPVLSCLPLIETGNDHKKPVRLARRHRARAAHTAS